MFDFVLPDSLCLPGVTGGHTMTKEWYTLKER